MSRSPRWLESPKPQHPHRAQLAYVLLVVGPSLLSVGLLAGFGALTGTTFSLGLFFVALMSLRQVNVVVVTLLYHRSMSHRTLKLHPVLEYVFRIWGWLTLAIGTRIWSLTHRVHHAHADTDKDVHSPVTEGHSLWTVGRQSIDAVRKVGADQSLFERLGSDLPSDRLERIIEWDHRRHFGMTGIRFPLLLSLITLAWLSLGYAPGIALGAAVCSLPGINLSVFTSTVFLVNGVAHVWGYRNYEGLDHSTNLLPIDFFGLGEALHNNHHAAPGCANNAHREGEIDPGFLLAKLLASVGLVTELKEGPARHARRALE